MKCSSHSQSGETDLTGIGKAHLPSGKTGGRMLRFLGILTAAVVTLLTSSGTGEGVRVVAHNESRVMVKRDGSWKVVHVHKSPAWPAPHVQP